MAHSNRRTWQNFEEMRKAADEGDAVAQCYVGICFQNGQNVPQDNQEAVRWFRKAADQNDTTAQCYLGFCYQNGLGVPQEFGQAAKWFREAAEQGDPSGLALMSLAAVWQTPTNITWGAFFSKAYSADYDPSRDYAADMDPPGSILGSPVSLGTWSTAWAWPVRLIPAELRQAHPSDVETLLISGSVDVAAPAELATEELLPYLSKGQQVILAEASHNDLPGIDTQPQATERLITSFLDTGVADDSLYTYAPIDFQVSWGYPALAKIGLALVLLLIALAVGGIWFILQRVKRRLVGKRQQSTAYPSADHATAPPAPASR